jgi:hypothetical protein
LSLDPDDLSLDPDDLSLDPVLDSELDESFDTALLALSRLSVR